MATLYYFSIPLSVVIVDSSIKSIEGLAEGYSIGKDFIIIMLGLYAVVGFYLGLKVSGFSRFENTFLKYNKSEINIDKIEKGLILILYATLTLIIMAYWNILIIQLKGYSEAWAVADTIPIYSFLIQTFEIACGILLALYIRVKKIKAVIFLSIVLLYIIFTTGDKNPLVILIFSMASGYGIFEKKHNLLSVLYYIIMAIILLIFIKSFSYYQGGASLIESVTTGILSFDITTLDPLGPYYANSLIISKQSPYLLGATYMTEIINIVPNFIYPDRPDTMPVILAKEYLTDYVLGRGMGYSPLAESYLNFGTEGAIINFIIMGWIFGMYWRVIIVIFRNLNIPTEVSATVFHIVGMYTLLLTFRGTSLSFVKMSTMMLIPLIIGVTLFKLKIK